MIARTRPGAPGACASCSNSRTNSARSSGLGTPDGRVRPSRASATTVSNSCSICKALEALTNREREVVALVAEGLSNEEIAERLFISPATAKTHVSRAMRELRAHDRAQLVVIADESGLVRPGWHG